MNEKKKSSNCNRCRQKNIGRATCESLSKLGFNILVHANTDKDGATETVDLIKKNGCKLIVLLVI